MLYSIAWNQWSHVKIWQILPLTQKSRVHRIVNTLYSILLLVLLIIPYNLVCNRFQIILGNLPGIGFLYRYQPHLESRLYRKPLKYAKIMVCVQLTPSVQWSPITFEAQVICGEHAETRAHWSDNPWSILVLNLSHRASGSLDMLTNAR